MRLHVSILALTGFPAIGAVGPIPVRTPVDSLLIDPAKPITHVEMIRVDFLSGQEMPEHVHPVPVVCFVTRGIFLVRIGTSPVRRVRIGETTLEPAGTIVHSFRNASLIELAELNCALLVGPDDKVLSVMLPAK